MALFRMMTHDIDLGLEKTRSNVETQLQSLQNSSSHSSTELQALQSQVTKLESSNRETLSLLDSKSTAHDKIAEDLSSQHQKTTSLRREVSTLEERIQSADNTISAAKFRESALQQEVDLLKRNNEWFDSELKTKSGEYSKYRKDKGARIAELQRLNEDATSNINSLQRTENTLRKRLDEVSQKADDAFSKIQQMQDEATRTEESFRAELDNSRRLAELQKQSADTAKRRVQELDDLVEQTKNDAADEISQVQAELETERQSRESAEQKVEELEMRGGGNAASVPGTPRGSGHGFVLRGTPNGAGSPSIFSPARSHARGGLSFTQLYAEYNNAKIELDNEKRRNEKLSVTIDEMIQELERKGPEIHELQLEHGRLQAEVSQLSSSLSRTGQEKDLVKKENRKYTSQVEGLKRESDILRQQLRDLGAQIKILLVEIQTRDDGVELSLAERQRLQKEAHGQYDEQELDGVSETAQFVSQRLVTFRSVFELQEKNSDLLHLTRQLGDQLEGAETQQKRQQQENDRAEIQSLRDRVERYKDELQGVAIQSQSYIRERDMFRRMLSHRGRLPHDTDLAAAFGQSVNGTETPRSVSVAPSNPEESATSKQLSDHIKLLKELQSHFDAYRQEAATDHSTLKAQLDKLARDKGDLQRETARVNSQLTLAHERYEMLQANYHMVKSENEEMHKRSQSLAESAAKQDIRTQQVAEELIEARGLSESMRNETANLKAEKELWKRIEGRLTEDNRALVEERGRLNKAISDSQSIFNEREMSESETRRQLNSQIAELESQLRSVSRKLEQETEESKKAALRREYEADQNRTRTDDLVNGLGNTKEELAAVKSTRDQLDARVGELKIELRTAQDRAQALRPRLTPRPTTTTSNQNADDDSNSLSREQELSIEVTDLKRELDLAKSDLENAHAQVEQYKAISQTSEEELQNLNDAHDQYKEDSDKIAAEKDAQIKELERRMEEISNELSVNNTQLSELRKSSEDTTSRLDQQRTIFEEEVHRIKDESERHLETAKFHQKDLKAQAEIAQQAQQSYENELVKHAEAAKMLQKTRSDYNELRLEIGTARADAEAARATVAQNGESWSSTKEQYEREFLELKRRRDDVDNQNRLLHQQLENITSQISSLQQKRTSFGEEDGGHGLQNSDLQSLQEVIKYLRREKEIVDVQYELSVQESRRVKQQLDYSQSQLDEARLRLDQERQRQADQERNSISHDKLLDTINELNVFRESSVTLRYEARQAQAQLADKTKQVEDLVGQIEPLRASLREFENEKETTQGELKLLQEDRDRWQERTQSVMHKYDRVDPTELEAQKEKLSTLERERDEATAEKQSLQERVEGIPGEIQRAQEELKRRLGEQFKSRSRELSGKIKAAETENQRVREEVQSIQAKLEEAQKARDEALASATRPQPQGSHVSPSRQAQNVDSQMADASQENQNEEGEVEEDNRETSECDQQRISAAEIQAEEESARANQLQDQVSELQARSSALEKEVEDLQNQINEANGEIADLRMGGTIAEPTQSNEHMDKLREDLSAAQNELNALKASTTLSSRESQPTPQGSEAVEAHVSKMREELEATYVQKDRHLQEQYDNRTRTMKAQLNTKLGESRNNIRDQLQKEHEEAAAKLQKEHENAVAGLRQEHEKEVAALRANHKEELDRVHATLSQTDGENAATAVKDFAQQHATSSESTPDVTKPAEEWELTAEQARMLCAKNSFIREVLKRNIQTRVDQEITKVREQFGQQFEEARQKADKVKEQAVVMESKKFSVKLSMAENKLRIVTARLEIFEKAAGETPQRPVFELWAMAKDFKPPPANATGQPQQQGQTAISVQTPGAVAAARSDSAQGTVQSPKTATPRSGPRSAAVQSSNQDRQEQTRDQQYTDHPLARPPSRRQSQNPPSHNRRQSQGVGSRPPSRSGLPRRPSSAQGDVNGINPADAKPGPSQGQGQQQQQQHQGAGTGPAALRGIANQGTGIPRGGANVRGIARGGGGQGQATHKLPDAPLGQSHATQNARGRGGGGGQQGQARGRGGGGSNLSPQAPHFAPSGPGGTPGGAGGGNKRPREDGDAGNVPEKRGRGRGGLPIGRGGRGRGG